MSECEGAVIVESRIKRAGKRTLWITTEVHFKTASGGVFLDKPSVLSLPPCHDRDRLESVMWAMLDAKGAYFKQILAAVNEEKKAAK